MKYRRTSNEANQGYHRQQAQDLLQSMSREDAIEFCLIQDWQGILNALLTCKQPNDSTHMVS